MRVHNLVEPARRVLRELDSAKAARSSRTRPAARAQSSLSPCRALGSSPSPRSSSDFGARFPAVSRPDRGRRVRTRRGHPRGPTGRASWVCSAPASAPMSVGLRVLPVEDQPLTSPISPPDARESGPGARSASQRNHPPSRPRRATTRRQQAGSLVRQVGRRRALQWSQCSDRGRGGAPHVDSSHGAGRRGHAVMPSSWTPLAEESRRSRPPHRARHAASHRPRDPHDDPDTRCGSLHRVRGGVRRPGACDPA